jgi:tripartite-type tricarboxylate transporter receptor subunit TctC
MKKRILATLVAAIAASLAGTTGNVHAAEKYPVKPITCIVGVEAGADGDVLVRPIMQSVSKMLGQPIVIVNKPGGGSSIAYREIHAARPDGYTIGWGSATIITNKLQGVSPLDYHDFTHLGGYATFFPIVIASTKTNVRFNTIQEAIAHAKANPGKLNMSTAGVGQSWWVAAMSFLGGTGIKVNTIPQPGAGAMTVAQVAGGHAELGVAALGSAKSMVDSGQVKFLATLGEGRAPAPYDKIPTVKELGYDVSWESTNFVMGPPKMPQEVVKVLVAAIEKAAKDPAYVKFAQERNTRWEYIAPQDIVPAFDKRRVAVREIMSRAGILKEAK